MTDLLAPLEPFLILARSTKGAAAAKVINDATAAPGVYVFSELLDQANVKELQNDQNLSKAYLLLQLFAYGTLQTYSSNTDSYPPLSPAHLLKLKHLTLVSLALEHRSLPYDQLLNVLQLGSVRELEDLIIDVIYAGLLGGKMHHHEKLLHVDWVTGRDVSVENLPKLQESLQNWITTAQQLLHELDEKIMEVRQTSAHDASALIAYTTFRNSEYNDILSELKKKGDKSQTGAGNALGGVAGFFERSTRSGKGGGATQDDQNDNKPDLPRGKGKSSGIAGRMAGETTAMDLRGVAGRGSKRSRE